MSINRTTSKVSKSSNSRVGSVHSSRSRSASTVHSSSAGTDSINMLLGLIGGLVVMVCVFTLGFFSGKIWGGAVSSQEEPIYSITGDFSGEEVTELDFDQFWNVWNTLMSDYVDEDISEEDLYYGAIKGMVAGIGDPATIYLTPEETDAYQKGNEGKFEGIGAELGYDNGYIIVVTPLDGSPALEAGLKAGDRILKVDGKDIVGKNIFEVVTMIRGEKGTKVVLTVAREGEIDETEIEIVRGEIAVPSVDFDGMEGEIAVIDVSRFSEASAQVWQVRWDEVVDEVAAEDPKAVIVDLRGNPGGYFNSAVWAAGEFLPSGTLVSQQTDRNGEVLDFRVSSQRDGEFLDIPVVVLVDSGSASASEILAGALQHHDRAYIIGENTYGKGTAQSVIDYTDGSSMHITTLKWLLPDGSWLSPDNVIEPDEVVEYTDEYFKNGDDPQIDEALEYLNSEVN